MLLIDNQLPDIVPFRLLHLMHMTVITITRLTERWLTKTTTQFALYAINPPPIIQAIFGHSNMDFIIASEEENESIKKAITEGDEAFLSILLPMLLIDLITTLACFLPQNTAHITIAHLKFYRRIAVFRHRFSCPLNSKTKALTQIQIFHNFSKIAISVGN